MPSSYGTQSVPTTNCHSVFAGFFMATAIPIDLGRLTRELGIDQQAIARTVALLDEGNTVPFITRYRRDQTGGLDEEQIRGIEAEVAKQRQLLERKQTILRSIHAQGKLTPELAKSIGQVRVNISRMPITSECRLRKVIVLSIRYSF